MRLKMPKNYVYFCLFFLSCVLRVDVLKLTNDSGHQRYKRQAFGEEKQCAVSSSYLDKTVTYKCSKRAPNKSCVLNGETAVLEFTRATLVCKPGYHLERSKTTTWICLNKSWSPKLPQCKRTCDELAGAFSLNNVVLACYRNNSPIDCNGQLVAGDRVRPVCKQLHTYRDFVPNYQELVCQEDGRWDNVMFVCVPGMLFMLYLLTLFAFVKKISAGI